MSCKFLDPFLSRHLFLFGFFSGKIMKLMNARTLIVNGCSMALTWLLNS